MSDSEPIMPEVHNKPNKCSPYEHHYLSADEMLEMDPDQAFEAALRHEVALCVNDKHALEWATFVEATVSKYRLAFAETAALAVRNYPRKLSRRSRRSNQRWVKL